MNSFFTLLLVAILISSVANGASWWRKNKKWAKPVAMAGVQLLGRDVADRDYANLEKSLGFKPNSEEFADLFKIADEDGNRELDEIELEHLKNLAHDMKKLRKLSIDLRK